MTHLLEGGTRTQRRPAVGYDGFRTTAGRPTGYGPLAFAGNIRAFPCRDREKLQASMLLTSAAMSVHAIRRRCILCSSPMLGIAKHQAADVCFICGLSAEEQAKIEVEANAVSPQPAPRRRNRAALRSV